MVVAGAEKAKRGLDRAGRAQQAQTSRRLGPRGQARLAPPADPLDTQSKVSA
jgi:hypothetical protein